MDLGNVKFGMINTTRKTLEVGLKTYKMCYKSRTQVRKKPRCKDMKKSSLQVVCNHGITMVLTR